MIVSIPILILAVIIAAALAGFVAWTTAASRANAASGVRETELARLSEQARRLPELTAERDQARALASQIEAEKISCSSQSAATSPPGRARRSSSPGVTTTCSSCRISTIRRWPSKIA